MTAARVHQQADAARTELEIRRTGDANLPIGDISLVDLRRRLSQAEARLESMDATVRYVENMADQYKGRSRQLAAELALVLERPPATGRARMHVTTEQATADRIDHLRQTLGDTRLGIHTARGRTRQTLEADLQGLLTQHPDLSRPEQCRQRWDMLLSDARDADNHQASTLQSRIADTETNATKHISLAQACKAERDSRATFYDKLAGEIAQHPETTPSPSNPSRPRPQDTARVLAEAVRTIPRTQLP